VNARHPIPAPARDRPQPAKIADVTQLSIAENRAWIVFGPHGAAATGTGID